MTGPLATTTAVSTPPTATKGAVFCATAMLLLGASVSVTPALLDYPILMGQMWRYLLGGLALLLVARVMRARLVKPTVREFGWLLLVAAVGMAAFNVLLLLAVGESNPSVTASIIGCAPVVLALLAPILTRRRVERRVIAGAVIVSLGVALAQQGGSTTVTGLWLSAAVMLCEVGFTLLATPVLGRLGAVSVATWASLLSAPLLLTAAVITGTADFVVPTFQEGSALLWMALVMTALAFSLWYSGVGVIGPARASLFTGFLPLGAVLATLVYDVHSLTLRIIGGAVVASVGILVGSRRRVATARGGENEWRQCLPSG